MALMLVAFTYADDDCYCEMNGIEVDDDDCGCDDSHESDEVYGIAFHKLPSSSGLLWETDRRSTDFNIFKILHVAED